MSWGLYLKPALFGGKEEERRGGSSDELRENSLLPVATPGKSSPVKRLSLFACADRLYSDK